MPRVIIIGAGLAGSLLSIYLARRGFAVDVFEARPDMRKTEIAAGRSINLALSDRGIAALREVGMDEYMLAEAVPMYGRMIHSPEGETKLLPYSGRKGECINSVSRTGLNIALMNEAENFPNVRLYFNHRLIAFSPESKKAVFDNGENAVGDTFIGTDGFWSQIRKHFVFSAQPFDHSEVFLDYRYVELSIPPNSEGCYQLEKNALHIWPRHNFMMIALPNTDGSFTCTLFLPSHGEDSFESIVPAEWRNEEYWKSHNAAPMDEHGFRRWRHPLRDDAEQRLIAFFERYFPDVLPIMPTLTKDYFGHPIGDLGTVRCWPWNIDGKALLIGDSAHAMVPFYGQGMNCAFEDVRVLDGLIDKHGGDWPTVYEEYGRLRKENTGAIQDMAEENFYEMRDATADHVFQRKRELETKLEQTYPDYFSKYSMVTFREDLPYSVAKGKGNAQDKLLMNICREVDSIKELNLNDVMTKIRHLVEKRL